MLPIYYRTYVTHAFLAFLAFLFGIDQSSARRNINPLQPLLAGIFRIPERRVQNVAGLHNLMFARARPGSGAGGGVRQASTGRYGAASLITCAASATKRRCGERWNGREVPDNQPLP